MKLVNNLIGSALNVAKNVVTAAIDRHEEYLDSAPVTKHFEQIRDLMHVVPNGSVYKFTDSVKVFALLGNTSHGDDIQTAQIFNHVHTPYYVVINNGMVDMNKSGTQGLMLLDNLYTRDIIKKFDYIVKCDHNDDTYFVFVKEEDLTNIPVTEIE